MRFENLDVWKRSVKLAVEVFRHLQPCRDYGFRDQITRSALSIPSNIAEGCERLSRKESVNFFAYAKGSCGEFSTQTLIGIKIGFIDEETGNTWRNEAEELSKMLGGLIGSNKSKTT